jgi:hypothetical protein
VYEYSVLSALSLCSLVVADVATVLETVYWITPARAVCRAFVLGWSVYGTTLVRNGDSAACNNSSLQVVVIIAIVVGFLSSAVSLLQFHREWWAPGNANDREYLANAIPCCCWCCNQSDRLQSDTNEKNNVNPSGNNAETHQCTIVTSPPVIVISTIPLNV